MAAKIIARLRAPATARREVGRRERSPVILLFRIWFRRPESVFGKLAGLRSSGGGPDDDEFSGERAWYGTGPSGKQKFPLPL